MENKVKRHFIYDIPVLGALIGCVLSFLFSEVVFGMIGTFIDAFMGIEKMFSLFFAAFGGVLFLLIYKRIFKGEFKGFTRFQSLDKSAVVLILVAIIGDLGFVASSIFTGGIHNATIATLGTALVAGVCEEVAFRAIPMSCAMRKTESKASIIIAMCISVIVFGLVHSMNALQGQSVMITVAQILFSAGFGLFVGAVYLRTGNILITMIFHFLHDYLAFIQYEAGSTGIIKNASNADLLQSVALGIGLMIIGIMLLKGHSGEIQEVWRERWK